jgi:hypothetical protein
MLRSATKWKNIYEDALWKLEQRLAHIRENLATRELAKEFEAGASASTRKSRVKKWFRCTVWMRIPRGLSGKSGVPAPQ